MCLDTFFLNKSGVASLKPAAGKRAEEPPFPIIPSHERALSPLRKRRQGIACEAAACVYCDERKHKDEFFQREFSWPLRLRKRSDKGDER